jgi:uncharacterized protein DUF4824
MRRKGPIIACALVVLTNAYVLVGVAWNRSGEPESEIVLTEQELPMPDRNTDEDTDIVLHLEWRRWVPPNDDLLSWFDQAKLEAIGFDCSIPPTLASAFEFYRRQVSRKTWIVLEYDGAAFQSRLGRLRERVRQVSEELGRQKATPEELDQARRWLSDAESFESRLVPVDAGNDVSVLRSRYADRGRYLILQGRVRISPPNQFLVQDSSGSPIPPPAIRGWIEEILDDRISVPPQWRSTIISLRATEGRRYQVTLRTGRRREPWIVDLRLLPPREREAPAAPARLRH